MTHRRRVAAAVVALALLGAGCGSDGGGDVASFCAAVEALRADDPFADLPVASPDEMRAAFAELGDGVAAIADAAPDEASIQADRYLDAVDALVDELAGAAYDPTRLDTTRYRQAVDDYTDAAISVDNAADAVCEG